ncbi:hypothetical protein PSHT_04131 [Puccinia striiformis]|uniref:Uncharacterized protein n=1 Tax=Puccinia striiformis TaxID=27350 RepID=A0A2S4WE20_9BASI|nr:hypothetical protein PSHT_04131 [Puccinia striiformis]
MLLTKILVALQMLHHHVILGHPLALPKPLVKRAETPIEMLRGVKEDAGPLQFNGFGWIGKAKIQILRESLKPTE